MLNAMCLPVMSYGSQLWFWKLDATGLTKMLQVIQNEMVKIVSGSFHMAPWEALLHVMRMLPMQHYIEKLTHTSALHLYRLPWCPSSYAISAQTDMSQAMVTSLWLSHIHLLCMVNETSATLSWRLLLHGFLHGACMLTLQ